jgi:magnesium chelatase family protein
VARYRGKLSGPFLDRIDLIVEVPALQNDELQSAAKGESSAAVRDRVIRARAIQAQRQGRTNALLEPAAVDRHCQPDADAVLLMKRAIAQLSLSARAYHRVLRVARSIADLAGVAQIRSVHVAEAVGYRRLFREA